MMISICVSLAIVNTMKVYLESTRRMSVEIIYREIHLNELDNNMLKNFNRYQNVLKDWCYEN